MNQGRFVDDEEAVVEFVGGLDRERVGVLRVELRHIDGMKQFVPPAAETSCPASRRVSV